MWQKYRKDKQKGIIPAILALIIAVVAIVVLVLVLWLIIYLNHLIAGLIGGGDQPSGYYSGNCATTTNSSGLDIPAQKGKIVREQHWVTTSESFPDDWPSSERDQLDRHFQMTNFSMNCSGCPKEGWTPTAGGGHLGGGNTVKPSLTAEPWMMNMQWKKGGKRVPGPPPGTKVIITSTKTGKSVVAAAGYEWGPEENSRWIAGATSEVLKALGIDTDGEVSIGFASDQNLPYGPIVCGGVNGSGPCGQNLVNIAISQLGVRENGKDCVPYNNCDGIAWCDTFVNWVFKQAGFDYMYKNCFEYLVCSMDYFKKNQTFIDVRNGDTSQIRPGDYFWQQNTDNNSGWHVGLVEYVSGNEIHTIEGNASKMVKRNIKKAGPGNLQIHYVGRLKNCNL